MTDQHASRDDPMGDPSDWTTKTYKKKPAPRTPDNTEKTGNLFKVLLKIPIPNVKDLRINQHADIKAVVDKLLTHNTDIKIMDLHKRFQITSTNQFPSSPEAFDQFFSRETAMFRKPVNKTSGHYSTQFYIEAMKPFSAIKNPPVYNFLVANKIFLTPHSLTTNQTARMAIIINKHTKITHIQTLQQTLRELIHNHMCGVADDAIPEGLTRNLASQLFIRTETIVHRLPDPTPDDPNHHKIIDSTVFGVYTNKDHATALGNFIAEEDFLNEHLVGNWVPWSARFEPEMFANRLREHNSFQRSVKFHVLEGVTREMMACPFNDPTADEEYESAHEAIYMIQNEHKVDDKGNPIEDTYFTDICYAPEPTSSTDTTGRWLVPYINKEDSELLLNHLIEHAWTEFEPMSEDNRPRIVPRRRAPQLSASYIASQNSTAYSYTGQTQPDSFNRGKLPTRPRPPMFEIDTQTNQPSWASIARQQPHTTPATTKPAPRIISPMPYTGPPTDTTISSQRTALESLIHKLQQETKAALAEQNAIITSLLAQNKQLAKENSTRANEMASLTKSMTDIQSFISQVKVENQARDTSLQLQLQEFHQTVTSDITTQLHSLQQTITADLTTVIASFFSKETQFPSQPTAPPAGTTLAIVSTPPRTSHDDKLRQKRAKPSTPTDPPDRTSEYDQCDTQMRDAHIIQFPSPASHNDDGAAQP